MSCSPRYVGCTAASECPTNSRGLLLFVLIVGCRSAGGSGGQAPAGPSAATGQVPHSGATASGTLAPAWWSAHAPCPKGTRLRGAAPPKGTHVWCEKDGGVRHGPATTWYSNGRKASVGRYRAGVFSGDWELWSEDGSEHLRQRWSGGKLLSTETVTPARKR